MCTDHNVCSALRSTCSVWLPAVRLKCLLGLVQVQREAIQAVEQDGIVFIDEIDKIVVNQDLRYGELPYAEYMLLAQLLFADVGQCLAARTRTHVTSLPSHAQQPAQLQSVPHF